MAAQYLTATMHSRLIRIHTRHSLRAVAPFDLATFMDYTGIDPMTGKEVYVAKALKDRKMQ